MFNSNSFYKYKTKSTYYLQNVLLEKRDREEFNDRNICTKYPNLKLYLAFWQKLQKRKG